MDIIQRTTVDVTAYIHTTAGIYDAMWLAGWMDGWYCCSGHVTCTIRVVVPISA